ncbi:MAG: YdcF family protein, partial [Leptospirales bacterium]|nr:YdcF family protein [Leptospirales bacterium]
SIRLLFSVAVIAFLLSFIILEVLIIKSSKNINTENSFYVVLLGAGLNGSKPSLTLLQRIKIATKYLNENRNVRVIVSGGKGAHETYTEAEIMSKLLQNNGIEKERIIIEDRSANTYENLTYSKELIDINKKVIIVTSGFHLFRAKLIARKLGYKDIGSIASKPPLLLLPNYYVREYFAVLKELIMNRI